MNPAEAHAIVGELAELRDRLAAAEAERDAIGVTTPCPNCACMADNAMTAEAERDAQRDVLKTVTLNGSIALAERDEAVDLIYRIGVNSSEARAFLARLRDRST